MISLKKLKESSNLTRLLDTNNTPVARARLFSEGIRTNNRMKENEPVTGDKGCLACGNCVDNCPVVREKRRFVFTLNRRTSMFLENTVGDECRRCYRCIQSCPQVSKVTKEFVAGFRRAEKFVHVWVASLIFCLAGSGIFCYHYKEHIPHWQTNAFMTFHVICGFLLLCAPFLYWFLDKHHMKRALKNSFSFGKEDVEWLKGFGKYLVKPGRTPLPNWKEFNTYHKFWFSYLTVMIPILGYTGIMTLLIPGENPLLAGTHAILALTVDLLVITHIYFKLLRRIFRDTKDMGASYVERKDLQYPFLYSQEAGTRDKQ